VCQRTVTNASTVKVKENIIDGESKQQAHVVLYYVYVIIINNIKDYNKLKKLVCWVPVEIVLVGLLYLP